MLLVSISAWYCTAGRSVYPDYTLSPADAAQESDDDNWQEKEASRTHSVKFTTEDGDGDPNKEVISHTSVQQFNRSCSFLKWGHVLVRCHCLTKNIKYDIFLQSL